MQRLVVVVVDRGQVRQLAVAQLGERRLEAHVARSLGEARKGCAQELAVLGLDRSDQNRGSVPEWGALRFAAGQEVLSVVPAAVRSAAWA